MNEKIAEIAKKAGITFKPMMIDGEEYSYQHVHFNDYTKGVEDEAGCIKLFAELIVQECASMARVYCAHEYDFTGDLELDEFMLKHFGIA